MVAGETGHCIPGDAKQCSGIEKPTVNTPSSANMAEYRVTIVSSEAGFDALGQAWGRLVDEGGISVFQSFEWQRTWWKHYGEHNPWMRLFIVVVTHRGEVVAIAPCCIETLTTLGVLHVRCLAFLGRGKSDYLDVIARPGMEAEITEQIARSFHDARADIDLLMIEDVPERSSHGKPLYDALQRHGFTGERFVGEFCPRTTFGPTWPETSSSLPSNANGRLDKRRRQLVTRHKAEPEFAPAEAVTLADIDEFIALHQQRWESVGQSGLFADRQFAEFFREAVSRLKARGWPMLAFLRLDGKRVAGICGFLFREEYAYYLNGLGEAGAAKQFSPGLVLHLLCMEEVFRRGGRTYDFLRGVERYKYELGAVNVPNWTLLMYTHPGPFVKGKYRVYLLHTSLVRRVRQEWSMIRQQSQMHGALSVAMIRYMTERGQKFFHDGVAKVRVPEQAVLTTENQR
jgi:CelD/BcsL family acetyltransferase involved in cellulose biosynthesis